MNKFIYILIVLSSVQLISLGNAERTKDKMYEKINTNYACFRRMNATHQMGCSSARSGSTGIIHFIEWEHDIDFLLKNGKAGKYIPVMPTDLFTKDIVHNVMKRVDLISGIMLYKKNTTIKEFSHEDVCPNRYSSSSKTCEISWNKDGTGLLNQDFPFPIFLVSNEDQIEKIRKCYEKFNKDKFEQQKERSLCSLELNSFMFASQDTPTCIRRSNMMVNLSPVKFCDPIGDKNVWASLYPMHKQIVQKQEDRNNIESNKTYIVIAARMDTTSLFQDFYPGAVSPLTGLVALLTTANLLKKIMPKEEVYDKNVLFVLFNGESYDYIGSQRFLYDMNNNEFPIKYERNVSMPMVHIEDISLYVELSQLSNTKKIFIHRNMSNPVTDGFVDKMVHWSKKFQISMEDADLGSLPPASLQTFLKQMPTFPGLIMADHYKEYVNKFYNSIYDDADNIDYEYLNITDPDNENVLSNSIQFYIGEIAQVVAFSVYEEMLDKEYVGDYYKQHQLVDELFHCYLKSANCKIHRAVMRKSFDIDTPFGLYVGVTTYTNYITDLTGLTLAWLTGDVVENRTESNCTNNANDPIFQYKLMYKPMDFANLNTTTCVKTTMNYTQAYSPAFIIEDYDWSSGKYSSWSESSWREISVRMFLKPSARHETVTLVTGSSVMVLSMIIIYFVRSRAHIIFAIPDKSTPTNC